MVAYRKNLQHAEKLQKQAYDKRTKPRSYIPSEKVQLNSKYIKTKRNWKLEAKFFNLFKFCNKQVAKLQTQTAKKMRYS